MAGLLTLKGSWFFILYDKLSQHHTLQICQSSLPPIVIAVQQLTCRWSHRSKSEPTEFELVYCIFFSSVFYFGLSLRYYYFLLLIWLIISWYFHWMSSCTWIKPVELSALLEGVTHQSTPQTSYCLSPDVTTTTTTTKRNHPHSKIKQGASNNSHLTSCIVTVLQLQDVTLACWATLISCVEMVKHIW